VGTILSSSTIYVLMLASWFALLAIRAHRIKRKKRKLSQKHFAETLVQTFGMSTLLGLFMTNLDYFLAMILFQQPLIATESLIYSSLAFGIMDLLLVIYFFYYPLPD
jgi:uncharacterized membrane protein YesL